MASDMTVQLLVRLRDEASRGLEQISREATGMGAKVQTAGRQGSTGLDGLRGAAGMAASALGAVGVGFSLASAIGFIRNTINALDELNDIAAKTNLDPQTVGGLGFAAEQFGSDIQTVTTAFRGMNLAMAEAIEKSGAQRDAFTRLGFSLKDLQTLDPKELFLGLLDQIGKLPDEIEKNARANDIFKRSYQDLIPMIKAGSDEIQAQIDYYNRVSGNVNDAAKNADQLKDSVNELTAAMKGLVNESGLVPWLASAAKEASQVMEALRAMWNAGGAKKGFGELLGKGISGGFKSGADDWWAEFKKQDEASLFGGAGSRPLGAKPASAEEIAAAKSAADAIKRIRQGLVDETARINEKLNAQTIAGIQKNLAADIAAAEKAGLNAQQLADFKIAKTAEAGQAIDKINEGIAQKEKALQDKQIAATKIFRENAVKFAKKAAEEQAKAMKDLGDLRIEAGGATAIAEIRAQSEAEIAAYREMLDKKRIGLEEFNEFRALTEAQTNERIAQLQEESVLKSQDFLAGMRVGMEQWSRDIGTLAQQGADVARSAVDALASSTSSYFAGIVDGTARGAEAFKQYARNLLKSISDIINKMMIQYAVQQLVGLVSSAAGGGGGGSIAAGVGTGAGGSGMGGGSSSIVPGVGSGGGGNLSAINPAPRGAVQALSAAGAGSGGGGQTVNNTYIQAIDVQTFASYMAKAEGREVIRGTMQSALRKDLPTRAAARGV